MDHNLLPAAVPSPRLYPALSGVAWRWWFRSWLAWAGYRQQPWKVILVCSSMGRWPAPRSWVLAENYCNCGSYSGVR